MLPFVTDTVNYPFVTQRLRLTQRLNPMVVTGVSEVSKCFVGRAQQRRCGQEQWLLDYGDVLPSAEPPSTAQPHSAVSRN